AARAGNRPGARRIRRFRRIPYHRPLAVFLHALLARPAAARAQRHIGETRMLQLDAPEVAARLGRGPLIDALMRAFQADFQVPERQHYAVGGPLSPKDILLVMPAWRVGGCLGVKLVTVFPGNARRGESAVHATYALFDASTVLPLALLDGTELTRRRTAAASALAARYLARPDATRLLMVGTGGLAAHVIESHAAVRPINSVRVWGRRMEAAETVARGFADRPYAVEAVSDLQA